MCKELPTDFSLAQIFEKFFRDNIVLIKKQGACAEIRRQSWLKQLRVAVSTKASLPIGSSPQNSKTNFVDLRNDG
jgi:hypothetical protein